MPDILSTLDNHRPIDQYDAVASLLSLSLAAGGPLSYSDATDGSLAAHIGRAVDNTCAPSTSAPHNHSSQGVKQHRRLTSTGKTKRRMSDAREAASRPSPAALQASPAALSLATLSLSSHSSSKHTGITHPSSLSIAVKPLPSESSSYTGENYSLGDQHIILDDEISNSSINNAKNGKKRGMNHKCESCSKIYRHPSCLIKHRWEHTPHWREASKFVLSKHQQVQLLEAAAILSHISPTTPGTSLPEDRSLWPSFLSGGTLPKAEPLDVQLEQQAVASSASSLSSQYPSYPVSSSVPGNISRGPSAGPRMHNYAIPVTAGVTQLRPGLLGMQTTTIPTDSTSSPMPVPMPAQNAVSTDPYHQYGYHSRKDGSWTSSISISTSGHENGRAHPPESALHPLSGGGGWSLPHSSLRSISASSKSQSRSRSGSASGSRSDEESVDVEVDGFDECLHGKPYSFNMRSRKWMNAEDRAGIRFSVREEGEEEDGLSKEAEWDDMELEMDMD